MDKNQQEIRPPVVTLMGHVDHGKTTLLDAIRKTNVAARERGGITQHIGAYQISHDGRLITFIDTPGHAAFEKMRWRGADIADIVVLVVAANDGVKPQTIEAIRHIKAASKPVVVAITKTDLPDINLEKVKKELQNVGVTLEGWGGDTPVVEVSVPKHKGVDELLEVIGLVWQLAPKRAVVKVPFEGVVVESFLDKSRGPIVTVIVKQGVLKVGQKIKIDSESTIVKALIDDLGQNVQQAEPGKPVEILGFKKILEVGSIVGEQISTRPFERRVLTLADIIAKSQEAQGKFKVIIKADVAGSLEAIMANLPEDVLVIASGIGEVIENDISFAKVANAPILSFNSKINNQIKSLADREGVVIKTYEVIYDLLSDLTEVAQSFKEAKAELKIIGRAKIVAIFDIGGQKIAGAMVTHGRLKLGDMIILKTSKDKMKEAKIVSLKRFKKDTESVVSGQECGIGFLPSLDFREGDIIESLG